MLQFRTSNIRDLLVSADEAGRLFGITGRQIQSLAAKGVIPKAARGKYRLGDVVPGYISTLEAREKKRQIRLSKKQYLRMRMEVLRLRIAERRDTLALDAEERAAAVVQNGMKILSDALQGIAGRSTRNVEIRDAIEREVDFALAGAARLLPAPADLVCPTKSRGKRSSSRF